MKVLMTADTVGGVWSYAVQLCDGLEGAAQIHLAIMGAAPSPGQRALMDRMRHVTWSVGDFKLEWMCDPWNDVRAAGDWLLGLAERHAPDVIHLNNFAHGALNWNAPVLVVGHSCVLSWYEAVRRREPGPEWNTYHRVVGRGVRQAELVAAPTRAMLASLQRHYGPLARTKVIWNAADHRRFQPAGKEPFILSAGRLWDEAKNATVLMRAAPRLPWPVYLAGPARDPQGAGANLEHVRVLGALPPDDMAGWLSRAAIYAHPACYEPFGLTVLEAALSGCALVLADIPSLRELWGGAAVFAPSDRIDSWVRVLDVLSRDTPLRLDWARRALYRARRYGVPRMAAAYLETYRTLAGQSARRPATLRSASCA